MREGLLFRGIRDFWGLVFRFMTFSVYAACIYCFHISRIFSTIEAMVGFYGYCGSKPTGRIEFPRFTP
jgi:hypothetical protein